MVLKGLLYLLDTFSNEPSTRLFPSLLVSILYLPGACARLKRNVDASTAIHGDKQAQVTLAPFLESSSLSFHALPLPSSIHTSHGHSSRSPSLSAELLHRGCRWSTRLASQFRRAGRLFRHWLLVVWETLLGAKLASPANECFNRGKRSIISSSSPLGISGKLYLHRFYFRAFPFRVHFFFIPLQVVPTFCTINNDPATATVARLASSAGPKPPPKEDDITDRFPAVNTGVHRAP